LERELEVLQQKLLDEEDKSNKVYLHMYAKEHDGASTSSSTPSTSKKISVPELMHQLQVTQNELENIKVRNFSFFNWNFVLFMIFLMLWDGLSLCDDFKM
jgi:hypothetical protein